MPELPEVETTRRGLAPHVERQKVTAVRIYDRRLRWPVPPRLATLLVGKTIDKIDRRSKYLLFHTTSGTLIVHFGMTGSLRIYERAPARRRHDHLDITFANGALMRYHDPRRFGAVLWSPSHLSHPLLAALGPEPLEPGFTGESLHDALRKRTGPIKPALMNSTVVVGVGNIYASEALFRAGIRPTRQANRLSRASCARIVSSIRDTLNDAVTRGGSTLRDYVGSNGEPGESQFHHFVYGRAGKPCRVCGTPIRAARQAGRATTYCAKCQR
ncbi:MAG: bifunctional DNA-formamidopyrimidine glycosylase/DNA-(apurinic or apyrimidinic site) lyase [Betaproteobacteria bacterium]